MFAENYGTYRFEININDLENLIKDLRKAQNV